MTSKYSTIIGKIIYGAMFVVVLPALLIVWARMTEATIMLPSIDSTLGGLIVGIFGVVIMVSGMAAIFIFGHGLPMNAYPPARFVSEGIYHFLPHPIYTGFSILCFGVSIAAGSKSGLWLVSPAVVLGCVALVEGYEKRATLEHFGELGAKPSIHLPPNESMSPALAVRISAYLLGVIPWLFFIQITRLISDSISTISPLLVQVKLPVYHWAEAIYLSRLVFILIVPLVVGSSRGLRDFVLFGLAATGAAFLLFVAFPNAFPQVVFEPQGPFAGLLKWDQTFASRSLFSLASETAWTLLAARTFAPAGTPKRKVVLLVAFLIIASGLLTGTQTVESVVAGIAIFFFGVKIRLIWNVVRSATELVANSWAEWRFGVVRIINHGIYAGVGGFVSLSIVGVLTGRSNVPYVMMMALLAVVIASLSAQLIEGSSKLLRPYGWYGGVLGTFIGGFIAYALGANIWLLIAAFCVGAPWVQSAGRLRCLVQGCCHGREASADTGILYEHPMSRVCRLAGLGGVPVYPTQLYSILYNIVVAIIVGRLWSSGASVGMIIGIYCILTGLARFVEESYRGEPQTPILGGLRLYQALAILTVLGGIFVTMVGNTGNAPQPQFSWQAIAASAGFGLFALAAFGVDFPNSNRRFARLV